MGLGKWIMMYFTTHHFVRSGEKWRMHGIDKFYAKLKCIILLVELKLLWLQNLKILKGCRRNSCQDIDLVCQKYFCI